MRLNKLFLVVIIAAMVGCTSYPTMFDKKLTETVVEFNADGTVKSETTTEHTPDSQAQAAISNATPDSGIVEGCTFDVTELSETGEVALMVGQAAGLQMNPCINGSILMAGQSNYFDNEIVEAREQGSITRRVVGAGAAVIAVGSIVDGFTGIAAAGLSTAGDDYAFGDVNQTTNNTGGVGGGGGEGGAGGEANGEEGIAGVGAEGSEGGAVGGGGGTGNNLNIGRGNNNTLAGADGSGSSGARAPNVAGDGSRNTDNDGITANPETGATGNPTANADVDLSASVAPAL